MLDDLVERMRSLVTGVTGGPTISQLAGRKPAERIKSLRALIDRLDDDLPRLIDDALGEAAKAVGADVAMLIETRGAAHFVAHSTDVAIIEQSAALTLLCEPAPTRVAPPAVGTLKLSDALCKPIYLRDIEWLIVVGKRTGKIDTALFGNAEETLADLFTRLLQKRDGLSGTISYIDHVTSLPDRWATMNRIGEAMTSANRATEPAALLFVDINRFKAVNDTLGHTYGDKVLRAVATRMREALRANEFIGRIGGDEFAVVVPLVADAGEAEHLAARLYDAVEQMHIAPEVGYITVSVGIALYPGHATNQEEWLHHADMAMYRAKRLSAPYCMYDAGENGRAVTGTIFPSPPDAYDQQFLVCFQPIFDVRSGRVSAAEALVRWMHQENGVLSVAHTMQNAEKRRTFEYLDLWIAAKAMHYAVRWRQHGIERVHINASCWSDERIVRELIRTIEASGANAHHIAVEVDAEEVERDPRDFAHLLGAVKASGAGVGIDRYDAEQANLATFQSLPIDFVKLAGGPISE
ncbi:MAG TPA: diguanylate cyclase, partial [Candidatus Baltobacteraceae bacterium]|nr:diguanylate cyclase [Candidatus Baltobacteraceae bacterium]